MRIGVGAPWGRNRHAGALQRWPQRGASAPGADSGCRPNLSFRPFAAQELCEPRLVQHRYAQLAGAFELAARLGAGYQIIGGLSDGIAYAGERQRSADPMPDGSPADSMRQRTRENS